MQQNPQNSTQSWQQAIDTTVTCRTLIQYNTNLNPHKKEAILGQIEATLTFLRQRQAAHTVLEREPDFSPEQLADLIIGGDPLDQLPGNGPPSNDPASSREISLRMLRRLQRTYLSEGSGGGLAAVEERYRNVHAALARLQGLAELRRDATASDLTLENMLIRIKGFVDEQYNIFREFGALFNKALEGQNIDINTEAHSGTVSSFHMEAFRQLVRDISPLMSVYSRHSDFQRRRGPLRENGRDIAAFLIYLQDGQSLSHGRRREIVAELKQITSLLTEMVSLLVDYEQAVTQIMQAPSTLR